MLRWINNLWHRKPVPKESQEEAPEGRVYTLDEHLAMVDPKLQSKVPPGVVRRALKKARQLKKAGFRGRELQSELAQELGNDECELSPTMILFIVRLVLLFLQNPWMSPRRQPDHRPVFGSAAPDPDARETRWSSWYAQHHASDNSVSEHRLPDGSRIDVLDDEYAIEVERIHKWEESVGQSLFYSLMTGKKPKIVLLRSGGKGEDEDYLRCLMVASSVGITVETLDTKKALVQ